MSDHKTKPKDLVELHKRAKQLRGMVVKTGSGIKTLTPNGVITITRSIFGLRQK